MKIAIALGVWTLGSLLFGLVLGPLFGVFARRRHAEERFFALIDQLRILAGFRSGEVPLSKKPVPQPAQTPDSLPMPELTGTSWLSHWVSRQRGRIQ